MCEFVVSSDVYELARSSPRGLAFIVNIRKGRPGSEKDVALMTSLFSSMNYEVRIIENQTKEVGSLRDQQIFLGYACDCLSRFKSALGSFLDEQHALMHQGNELWANVLKQLRIERVERRNVGGPYSFRFDSFDSVKTTQTIF